MSTWRTRFIAILFCAASRSAIDYRAAAGGSVAWNAADGGWLLLEGCGNLAGTDIAKRFVALAGGPARSYVVISTAISNSEFTPDRLARCGSRTAQILGVAKVICLDARDHDEANSARFNAILRKADAVWIYGGDEERLVDRYVGTATVASLRAVLDRGGVLGGTSAGAMILASFVPVRATLPVSAFGFIPNATIAPHYTQRHYEHELRGDLLAHLRVAVSATSNCDWLIRAADRASFIVDSPEQLSGRVRIHQHEVTFAWESINDRIQFRPITRPIAKTNKYSMSPR